MTHDEHGNPSRRHFLKLAAGTAAAVTLGSSLVRNARAADLPHVTADDPTAKALQYTDDNTKATDSKHKAGDDCSNCQFYQGKAGDAWGPCQLFPGKDVNAKGWCISHSPKA
jgi:hypothetical protein